MIDEGALPILTEGTEEFVIARDNLNICKETVHQRDDIIESIDSHEEILAVAMVVDNRAEELSTPERPSGPLLEEKLPPAYSKDESERLRVNKFLNSNMNLIQAIEDEASKTLIDPLFDNVSNSSANICEEKPYTFLMYQGLSGTHPTVVGRLSKRGCGVHLAFTLKFFLFECIRSSLALGSIQN